MLSPLSARGRNRRGLLALAVAGAAGPAFGARTVTIGFLSGAARPPDMQADRIWGFVEGMREHGYVLGANLAVHWRFAEGDYARLPALAQELVAARVQVIVTAGVPPTVAAQRITRTVPIVMGTATDPVAAGVVKSLARPEGNVTGLSNMARDLAAKHLDLATTVVPSAGVAAMLLDRGTASHPAIFATFEEAAKSRGVQAIAVEVSAPAEIGQALEAARQARTGALIIPLAPLFNKASAQLAQLTTAARLPAVAGFAEFPMAGGLMSYGPNLWEHYRRSAYYVDRLLKGARPSDLPIEQPTTFQFVVNARTARAVGVRLPREVLVQATRMIQ